MTTDLGRLTSAVASGSTPTTSLKHKSEELNTFDPFFYFVTVRALMYDFIQVRISRGNIITAELNTDIWWTLT